MKSYHPTTSVVTTLSECRQRNSNKPGKFFSANLRSQLPARKLPQTIRSELDAIAHCAQLFKHKLQKKHRNFANA